MSSFKVHTSQQHMTTSGLTYNYLGTYLGLNPGKKLQGLSVTYRKLGYNPTYCLAMMWPTPFQSSLE